MNKKKILLFLVITLFASTSVMAVENNANSFNNLSFTNMSDLYEYNTTVADNIDKLNIEDILNNNTNDSDDDSQLWDKSRPIYFAMDHVNSDDEKIRDNIVNKLKENGFNVVKAEIGPNEMSQNTHELYENNITDAVVFHLFNGVDPSTIRELASNGSDNRGKIVRSNGNDVVLAWFYDSADPVNANGSAYEYVRGSETGPSLENPGQYMVDNDIVGICTSSDMNSHNESADYTGEKTADEFMKLFKE
ncbi:MAG: hypothetical protein BZ133_01505 [Methanosphaera sp. SHI613]|jgi:hypothetical protein|nr:MAG: hypothetical protein BZ133_01505 [Methanosphaera sp. SHI613]